jgi:hypothetical protein
MPPQFRGPVPPDHPLFSSGVSFVFCSELPEDEDEQPEQDDVADSGDVHGKPSS